MSIERRLDTFAVEEGTLTLEWPDQLSEASRRDIDDWLTIMQRKIARAVIKPEPPKEST